MTQAPQHFFAVCLQRTGKKGSAAMTADQTPRAIAMLGLPSVTAMRAFFDDATRSK
jgi:hypothetical protein